ncbi:MAG: pantoate--beta-alanine ligase [Cytophagaceae bacterium]|jgi:pantoate--beta-alanine ligase|nr:pantoate--beta-alanine ligase [Cytophagaceae bacterium]
MQVIQGIKELEKFRSSLGKQEQLGLVPTMGALHAGHLSLLEKARQQTDHTLVSIFVNPLQFNDSKDFDKYPKQVEKDLPLLEKAGCNIVFIPSVEEFYVQQPTLSFQFGYLEAIMEGYHRPGHFNGVAIVVSKLLNLIRPHKAFFGEKDLQQLRVIQYLVKDLSMPVEIVPCTTLREPDGLAMSSRNMRLDTGQRQRALQLNQSLRKAKDLLGKLPHSEIEELIQKDFSAEKLEYFSIVEKMSLKKCSDPFQNKEVALCIAAFIDEIRLIDNIIVSS